MFVLTMELPLGIPCVYVCNWPDQSELLSNSSITVCMSVLCSV